MLKSTYYLTRFIILRLLGFVYLFAFLSLATQVIPLIGHDGLYPADLFLDRVGQGTTFESFWNIPTLFWFHICGSVELAVRNPRFRKKPRPCFKTDRKIKGF